MKRSVHSAGAPKAIGPYSQGIEARGARPPERCVEPEDLFGELEGRGARFEVTVDTGVAA